MDKAQELAWLRNEIAQLHWQWAKTYAQRAPHWYIVRKRTAPPDVFDRLAQAIRHYGINQRFGPYRGRYLHLGDGHKYWHMGVCINRDKMLDPADWPTSC
jgi:hypothetical protein